MIIFLAGASGLCGQQLLRLLINDARVTDIYMPVRTSLPFSSSKIHELSADFINATSVYNGIKPDAVFCCLGTTIKKAGSQDAFRKVDEEMPVAIAQWAKSQGVPYMGIISALGSSENSSVFYNRVKGSMEQRIKALALPSVGFFRPSLLLGNRGEKRFGEKMAIWLFGSIRSWVPAKWRPVYDKQVAWAMWQDFLNHSPGSHYIENELMVGYKIK